MSAAMVSSEPSIYMATKQYPRQHQNLYDSLEATARRFPDKLGLIDEDEALSYGQFKYQVDVLASVLKSRYGLRHGDVIGLLMDNSIGFLRAFYAIAKLGCTAVMLNTKQPSPALVRCLEETGGKLLITQQKWRGKATDCLAVECLHSILFETGVDSVQQFLATESPDLQPADQNPPTVAIIFTSGTTGDPKGACVSHDNILQTAYSYEEVQRLSAEDTTVLCVPVYHILGLSCVSTFIIYLGATLVLQSRFSEKNTLALLMRHKATHFHSAPTVYIRLAKVLSEENSPMLDYLRVCICGGAVISDTARDTFCNYAPNASFRIAYGMTETAGGGTLAQAHNANPIACPGVSVMVVDQAMRPLPRGHCGQILLRGDVVIEGYLKHQTTDSFYNGWLCTGDLGSMTEDGALVLQGRLKEMINRGGEKVFPAEVERALLEHPSIVQAAVVGIPDSVYGEVPVAAIVPEKAAILSLAQIQEFLQDRLAKYEIPIAILVMDKLPQTASEKVAKHKLAYLIEKQQNSNTNDRS